MAPTKEIFAVLVILIVPVTYFAFINTYPTFVRIPDEATLDRPIRVKKGHVMDGKPKKMNVLFLMMDGFRTEMGAYMHLIGEQPWLNAKVKTPNLDKLAKEGMLFERAFATFGRCSASRSSMFVGRRPDSTHVHDMKSWLRDVAGENLITLPQYFKQNGYIAYGMGKSYCPTNSQDNDKWKSWDVMWRIPAEVYNKSWAMYPEEQRKTKPLWDDQLLDRVHAILDDHSKNKSKNPFFLFAGFKKPHLPLIVPEKYFELYPVEEMKRAINEYPPKNTPATYPGYHNNEELFSPLYDDTRHFGTHWKHNDTISDEVAIGVRRAYYASVSYIDDQLGKIMKKLTDSGFRNDTIVVFAADHGVHLGENALWGKDTSFEISTRIPLTITIPGVTKPNTRTRNFVELVDIFPTLIDAAQLPPAPLCPKDSDGWAFCTEGVSFLPLLTNKRPTHWKNRVFWQGRWVFNHEAYKAYTVRTDEYRYTEYILHAHRTPKQWPKTPFATELYHTSSDPGENDNLWANETYTAVMRDLSEKLHSGWRSAVPEDVLEKDT